MELDKFIEITLAQIISGVKKAQEANDGDNINAFMLGRSSGGNIMNNGSYGVFTRVDFDVAVAAESSKKGGANLKVFGAGIEGGGETKSETGNRITFSVPVRLPDGDQSRFEKG